LVLANVWKLFQSLINDAWEGFRAEFGDLAEQFMLALEQRIHDFFTQALQMDPFILYLEAKPDKV
jgi:hypothetical protein